MKDLIEIGIIFRGFIICNYHYKDIDGQSKIDPAKDLKGPFLAGINNFISQTFKNNPLEYLESGKHIFVFKMDKIKAKDAPRHVKEPIILYGLFEKSSKTKKLINPFLEKAKNLLNLFIERYSNLNFTSEAYRVKDFEFEFLTI